MTLGYSRNYMALGLKGQGHMVNKYSFYTNHYYAYVNAQRKHNDSRFHACRDSASLQLMQATS